MIQGLGFWHAAGKKVFAFQVIFNQGQAIPYRDNTAYTNRYSTDETLKIGSVLYQNTTLNILAIAGVYFIKEKNNKTINKVSVDGKGVIMAIDRDYFRQIFVRREELNRRTVPSSVLVLRKYPGVNIFCDLTFRFFADSSYTIPVVVSNLEVTFDQGRYNYEIIRGAAVRVYINPNRQWKLVVNGETHVIRDHSIFYGNHQYAWSDYKTTALSTKQL